MPKKSDERMQALREQAAALRRRTPSSDSGQPEATPPTSDLSRHFGIAALDQVTAGRTVQRLPIGHVAPDLRPESRQPRLLPSPEELLIDGAPNPAFAALVAELLELGHSLQERQIQPIIVYPGTSPEYPAARYLILVGHRRWTAACLVGLPELDAISIDPPTPDERVQLQYAENEERADFTDMERAWALQQMKRALNDAPWDVIETRMRLSTSRRHELTRLLAFTPEQQVIVAQLRLRENQLEPLHQAVRTGELSPTHVDTILHRLSTGGSTQRASLDRLTIARLIARVKRESGRGMPRTPQWVPPSNPRLRHSRQPSSDYDAGFPS